MLTLTDADRAKLAGLIPDNCTDPLIVYERQAIYRAGLAAGMERCVEQLIDAGYISVGYADDARAAIRALLKEQN